MPQHIDVDKVIADLKAQISATVLPPTAPVITHVIHRNRDVSNELMRMILNEENKGTDISLVVAVLAHFSAESVMQISRGFVGDIDDIAESVATGFVDTFATSLQRMLSGKGMMNVSVDVVSEQGGHA